MDRVINYLVRLIVGTILFFITLGETWIIAALTDYSLTEVYPFVIGFDIAMMQAWRIIKFGE